MHVSAAGLARGGRDGVRLLGKGVLPAKVSFKVSGASKGAIEAVEKNGGKVEVMEVVTAAEKAAAKSARQNVGRVRKAMRFARRLMR